MRYFYVALATLLAATFFSNATLAGGSFEKAAGEWASSWVDENGETSNDKLKFDGTGKMVYIPENGEFVSFQSADENGKWEGHWVGFANPTWRCENKYQGSHYWGVVLFQFNERYDEFEATYDICGKGTKYGWTGERIAE